MRKIEFKKKVYSLFLVIFVFFLMTSPKYQLIAETATNQNEDIDYILVIDESGSMRNNDPENLRVEAAKLFTDLSSMLGAGSRISVVGFGSQTNIYLPLTDISGGEQEIKDALEDIKDDQPLTDLKDVLSVIKEMLDNRSLKNDASVILLTDGAMTIDDIPPMTDEPEPEQEEDEVEREIPAGQVSRGPAVIEFTSKGDEEQEPSTDPEEDGQTQGQKVDSQKAYLEEYKQQVFDISQKFKDDEIEIHTIAFTEEAEIEILRKISSITDAGNWKADSASDIKDIYLEIFKHMTSRFLLKEDQKSRQESVTGTIDVDKGYSELVLIAFNNDYSQIPDIEIVDPGGTKYGPNIKESTYTILQIMDPKDGIWDYSVTGDAVIVYDFSEVEILEPASTLFLSGSEVSFKVRVTGNDPETAAETFSVLYKILYPDQSLSQEKGLEYNQEKDVFEATFDDLIASGNYNVEITINHKPTGSSSSKKVSLESVYLGLDIVLLEPSGYEYETGDEVPVQLKFSKKNESDTSLDLSSIIVIAKIEGQKNIEVSLNDDGSGSDEKNGDGIYSGIAKDLGIGEKSIHFYMVYNPLAAGEINTGIIKNILLSEKETVVDVVEEEGIDEDPVTENEVKETESLEEEASSVVDFYWKIILVVASIISAATIFLIVYFLYIRPKKRGY